jgi:hypothetical protein
MLDEGREARAAFSFPIQYGSNVGRATQWNEKSRQRFAGGFEIMTPSAP